MLISEQTSGNTRPVRQNDKCRNKLKISTKLSTRKAIKRSHFCERQDPTYSFTSTSAVEGTTPVQEIRIRNKSKIRSVNVNVATAIFLLFLAYNKPIKYSILSPGHTSRISSCKWPHTSAFVHGRFDLQLSQYCN